MNQFDNYNSDNEKEIAETEVTEEANAEVEETESEASDWVSEEVDVKKKKSAMNGFFEYVETFCYALVLMMVMLLFVFRMVTVEGGSMKHTFEDGDKLIISNLFYTPETGDIVVINPESHDKSKASPIIKRVIATGGQTVRIDYMNWEVFVDGVKLDEPYIEPMRNEMKELYGEHVTMSAYGEGTAIEEIKVSENMVFVLGDNRKQSKDSRSDYGEMSVDRILGRVVLTITPEFGLID